MNFDHIEAIRKVTVLDVTWTNCPEDVMEAVREIWSYYEYGNDNYIHKTSIDDLTDFLEEDETNSFVKVIIDYLEAKGLENDEEIWIHFWW